LLSQLRQMIYEEHLATMNALTENAFDEERSHARSEYRRFGELTLPWLQWAPTRTATDRWNASQERRKDPKHMAQLRILQRDLDEEANKLAEAVKEEMELRKAAQEFRQREMAETRKPIGRRYGRYTRKRRSRI